jgi:hypothetical protein
MRFQKFSFGSIRIEGVTYEHDVVIDRGDVRRRKKKPSKKFRDEFGHRLVSIEEKIPWPSDYRHWNGRSARDGRREKRSQTSEDLVARSANRWGYRTAEKASGRNERDLTRDVLTADVRCSGIRTEGFYPVVCR